MNAILKIAIFVGIALFCCLTSEGFTQDFTLVRGVVSSGGTAGDAGSINIKATIGSYASYHEGLGWPKVQTGYWNLFMRETGCPCSPGDADNNGDINILDILYLIDYKYENGPAPIPYEVCSGDADGNCIVNIIDILVLIEYKFNSGPAPCQCLDWTGACGIL